MGNAAALARGLCDRREPRYRPSIRERIWDLVEELEDRDVFEWFRAYAAKLVALLVFVSATVAWVVFVYVPYWDELVAWLRSIFGA